LGKDETRRNTKGMKEKEMAGSLIINAKREGRRDKKSKE
jgi:hypothetical protein